MARKAARLERAGALTPRDRMWAAIRALAARDMGGDRGELPFSAVEVQFLANLRAPAEGQAHADSVVSYLEGLSRAEPPYVAVADGERPQGRKRSELALYRLVRDVGVEAPRVTAEGKPVTAGIGNERMWAAMKVLRDFDSLELSQAASDEQHRVSDETAKTYIKHLERAGYVVLAARAVTGQTRARYRFNRAKNTGPRAPLVTKNKEVMDANSGRVVWPKGEGKCREQT